MKESFIAHVEEFGLSNTVLDRINNEGGYSKENCRWVTCRESNLNTRRSVKNKVCQKCMTFKPLIESGMGWRRIAKALDMPTSTVIYHVFGHVDYRNGKKIVRTQ